MNAHLELGPVHLALTFHEAVFSLLESDELMLEVPPTFRPTIDDALGALRPLLRTRGLVFDLRWLPGITSRQLGIVLTVRAACRRIGPLVLRNVSPGVERLLHLTQLAALLPLERQASVAAMA